MRLLLHDDRRVDLNVVLILGKVIIHRNLLILVNFVVADDTLATLGPVTENAARVRWREGVVDLTLAAKGLVLLCGHGLAAGRPGLLLAVAVSPLALDGKRDFALRHVVHHCADGLSFNRRIALSRLVNRPY